MKIKVNWSKRNDYLNVYHQYKPMSFQNYNPCGQSYLPLFKGKLHQTTSIHKFEKLPGPLK